MNEEEKQIGREKFIQRRWKNLSDILIFSVLHERIDTANVCQTQCSSLFHTWNKSELRHENVVA